VVGFFADPIDREMQVVVRHSFWQLLRFMVVTGWLVGW
jgi:hypothetical protein